MWLILALAAYFLFAAVTITDKYLLARPIPDARVYSFYMGILGIFVLLLAPFGLEYPSHPVVLVGIFSGALYGAALFLFFYALRKGEVSRIGISIGGLIPFFTLVFLYIWTKELPSILQLAAFAILMIGSFVVIFDRFIRMMRHLSRFILILTASFLFGLYFALSKFLFQEQSFISAIVWIRVGGVLFALLFLLSPAVRKMLFEHKKSLPKNVGFVFVVKNIVGGIASLFQHISISIASIPEISLINALQGAQFALVFLGAVFLTKKFPKVIKEAMHSEAIIVKSIGTALIVVGVVLAAMA